MEPIGKIAAALVQSPQQLTATLNASNAKLTMAAKYAKLLLGCYRVGDANDPEVYTAAVIRVLSDYPEDIVRSVVDPREGLPSKVQWLPTVKEIRAACNEIHLPRQRLQEMQERVAEQIAERERIESVRAVRKETWAETKADLERRGFNFGHKKRPEITGDELMRKHGVSQEQWDAIPDLPKEKFEEFEIESAKARR